MLDGVADLGVFDGEAIFSEPEKDLIESDKLLWSDCSEVWPADDNELRDPTGVTSLDDWLDGVTALGEECPTGNEDVFCKNCFCNGCVIYFQVYNINHLLSSISNVLYP